MKRDAECVLISLPKIAQLQFEKSINETEIYTLSQQFPETAEIDKYYY